MHKDAGFIHYTNWDPASLAVGMTFSTMYAPSYYWNGKRNTAWVPAATGLFQPFEEILKHGKYAAELLKEYVFEEVRLQAQPEAPSRRACMFAFHPDADFGILAKKLGLTAPHRSVLRVAPAGPSYRSHVGRLDLLDCNLATVEEMEERAHLYWTSHYEDPNVVEVLLAGPMVIKEILHLGESPNERKE